MLITLSRRAAICQFSSGEKNSRMRMKVQGRLMKARFIEIHAEGPSFFKNINVGHGLWETLF